MGTCPKCGRSNGNAVGGNSLCWECYSGRTDAYKNGPKMVGAVPQQKPQQHTESPTIHYSFTGYFKKHWYRNGDLYSGYMEDGYRHGKGKWTRAEDKYTYDGDWYMSKRHGHGKEEMPGKWRFEGEFYDNKRNGYGKLVCTDGEIYEGEWKDNKKHGHGKKTFASGSRYEGEWSDGLRCGKGIYFNAQSGVTYDGEWKDDKLNGHVVVSYADGRIYEGNFVDSSKIGNGKETAPDGTVTLGHWEGDRFVVDSVQHSENAAPSPIPDTSSPKSDEKEFDISPESLAAFRQGGIAAESKPAETAAPAVELMHDFHKRFCYFDQALYGIDKNGVLHISSKMKKNKEVVEACNGKSGVEQLAGYGAENIIILGQDGRVVFADSMWKKGLLASKAIKEALPEIQNWSGLSSVACGSGHFVGLRTDGTVIGAGNKMCHLDELTAWTGIKAIACSFSGTVGLREDGTVVSCGFLRAVANELATWTDIIAIACGEQHVVGLRRNGTVVACGENGNGQCDVSSFCNVGMISASVQCTALVLNYGTVKALGKYNDKGLGFPNIVAAACFSLGTIITLDKGGFLHGDMSGVDMDDFVKDFEW